MKTIKKIAEFRNLLLSRVSRTLKDINKNSCIAVAMSGGLDSTFIAIALYELGYKNIFGITMKHLSEERIDAKSCCSIVDTFFLKSYLPTLGINHYTINLQEEFFSEVIEYTHDAIRKGHTPTPCAVKCNPAIKFGVLLDYAQKIGAKYMVTGHYCKKLNSGKICIARDKTKDQTYFLSTVKKESLKNVLFPLAYVLKKEIIEFAKTSKMLSRFISTKKESQGVCFITTKYQKYVQDKVGIITGFFVDATNKNTLGICKNILSLTPGQKIFITEKNNFYYIKKKYERIVEVAKKPSDLNSNIVEISIYNVLNKLTKICYCRIRYHGRLVKSQVIQIDNNTVRLQCKRKMFHAIAPGQLVVLYNSVDKTVIASGVIK